MAGIGQLVGVITPVDALNVAAASTVTVSGEEDGLVGFNLSLTV